MSLPLFQWLSVPLSPAKGQGTVVPLLTEEGALSLGQLLLLPFLASSANCPRACPGTTPARRPLALQDGAAAFPRPLRLVYTG